MTDASQYAFELFGLKNYTGFGVVDSWDVYAGIPPSDILALRRFAQERRDLLEAAMEVIHNSITRQESLKEDEGAVGLGSGKDDLRRAFYEWWDLRMRDIALQDFQHSALFQPKASDPNRVTITAKSTHHSGYKNRPGTYLVQALGLIFAYRDLGRLEDLYEFQLSGLSDLLARTLRDGVEVDRIKQINEKLFVGIDVSAAEQLVSRYVERYNEVSSMDKIFQERVEHMAEHIKSLLKTS